MTRLDQEERFEVLFCKQMSMSMTSMMRMMLMIRVMMVMVIFQSIMQVVMAIAMGPDFGFRWRSCGWDFLKCKMTQLADFLNGRFWQHSRRKVVPVEFYLMLPRLGHPYVVGGCGNFVEKIQCPVEGCTETIGGVNNDWRINNRSTTSCAHSMLA